jgi:hypothetical protein
MIGPNAALHRSSDAPAAEAASEEYELVLRKPVGVVFAQNSGGPGGAQRRPPGGAPAQPGARAPARAAPPLMTGPLPASAVFVETVSPGSNAEKSGLVRAGDVLTACSATVLKVGRRRCQGSPWLQLVLFLPTPVLELRAAPSSCGRAAAQRRAMQTSAAAAAGGQGGAVCERGLWPAPL